MAEVVVLVSLKVRPHLTGKEQDTTWRGVAATVRDLGTKPVGRNENVHPRFGLSQHSAGEKGKEGVRFGKWRDMTHLHKCKKEETQLVPQRRYHIC